MLVPDHVQKGVWDAEVAPNLEPGAAVLFAHGLNIHFGRIAPPDGHDVIMVAPKAPGHRVRELYVSGAGTPGLVAVQQDASGRALQLALAYGVGIGCGRVGLLETTFAEETESDLFGEQAVLCGGVPALVQAGFDTLVEAGYQPEIAYYECLNELKLIVDLLYQGGYEYMRYSVSDVAEYGDLSRGPRIVDDSVRERDAGRSSRRSAAASSRRSCSPTTTPAGRTSPSCASRARSASQEIERVGKELRELAGIEGLLGGGAWRQLTSASPCSGYGTVGAAVNRLLVESADEIERATGHRLRVVRALVRDAGEGAGVRGRRTACSRPTSPPCATTRRVDVVAEVMGGLEPAGDYVRELLRAGKSVVTANKQLVARARRRAVRDRVGGRRSAPLRGVGLRGDPGRQGAARVARRLERAPRARDRQRDDELHPLAHGAGGSYAEALAEAQRLGYAEADPTDDVERRRRRREDGDPRHGRVRLARARSTTSSARASRRSSRRTSRRRRARHGRPARRDRDARRRQGRRARAAGARRRARTRSPPSTVPSTP